MKTVFAAIVLLLALAAADSVFVVPEGRGALLLQFGNIEGAPLGPGLHFKLPFAQRVQSYDTRDILTESDPDRYQTADGSAVQAGFTVRWRVIDPQAYYRATSGEELQATQEMAPLVRDALRSQVQSHSLSELGGDGSAVATRLKTLVDPEMRRRLGVQVLDIGIARVEYPDDAADAVYKRMQAGAKAQAAALRAQGEDKATAIRTAGERKAQAVLAQAQKDAAAARGDGDAQAAKIYADAGSANPQFFAFWSQLQSWRDTFGDGHAVVVLDRDSPFVKSLGGLNPANAPNKKGQ
ncbi:MAG TPA: SPFH domain-containing protein [Rhodanobacteraceae bacterium]|nr:SPFH domain-containing protein [Rhodanobacteraceae bacterium]